MDVATLTLNAEEVVGTTLSANLPTYRLELTIKSAMVSVLKDQDAVVSLLSRYAVHQQPLITDVAIEAGVSRFIPSDFGIDSPTVEEGKLSCQIERRIKTQNYLSKKADHYSNFSWTRLGIGLLFDYVSLLNLVSQQS